MECKTILRFDINILVDRFIDFLDWWIDGLMDWLIDWSIDWLICSVPANFKSLCFVIFMLDARRRKYDKGRYPEDEDLEERYELTLDI